MREATEYACGVIYMLIRLWKAETRVFLSGTRLPASLQIQIQTTSLYVDGTKALYRMTAREDKILLVYGVNLHRS